MLRIPIEVEALLFFDNGTWFPTGEAFGKKTGAASVTYDTRLFFYLFC
jgi:hypothetical protein